MPRITGHNSPLMKARNRSALLKLLLQRGGMTRRELARALRLTPATITNATRELIDLGLVTECLEAEARRSVPLCINAAGSYAVGVNMGLTGIGVGIADLRGQVRAHKGKPWIDRTPDAVVAQLVDVIEDALRCSALDPALIAGIGIGVAGVVDTGRGIVRTHAGLGWDNVALGELLAQALGQEVKLVNNVQAMALAERMYGVAAAVDDFVLVYVSTAIGAGIVIGGQLHQGLTFAAGMLAHLTVAPGGPLCSCGGHGCMETVASNFAVWQGAQRAIAGGRSTSLQRRLEGAFSSRRIRVIWEEAARGDALARELLRRQAHHVGLGIASLLYVLDPALIVLSTPGFDQHTDLGSDNFLDIVRQTAREQARLLDLEDRIVSSTLDEEALIQGGAAVVFSEFIDTASFTQ